MHDTKVTDGESTLPLVGQLAEYAKKLKKKYGMAWETRKLVGLLHAEPASLGCRLLCLSFRCHLAQQPPRDPDPVSFFERRRLFAERSSYSHNPFFNRPRSADHAAFKRSRNVFPEYRLRHGVFPILRHPSIGRSRRESDP